MSSHPLFQTAITLADGRELIYFDETAGRDRSALDRRDLPTITHTSQLRFDELAGEWVTIAGHRQTRTYHPPAHECPLCPSRPDYSSEIPAADYDVVVFENRFPSFSGMGPTVTASQLLQPQEGVGRCEVVCFTSDHHATMSALPAHRIRTVINVWTDRTAALAAQDGVAQVFCFENRGAEIGVTLDHPHGQIYGYPFVTPVTARMIERAATYRQIHGSNLFGDLLEREKTSSRMVAANDAWVAFVPYAARWPIEVHIYPRRQVPDLPALTDQERADLVPIYREALARMEGMFPDPLPLITSWQQAPVSHGRDDFWLHLRLLSIRRAPGKIKYLAGSESGMGAFISDTKPEDIAARLRAVRLSEGL